MASEKGRLTLLERARRKTEGHEGNSLWDWSNLNLAKWERDNADYWKDSKEDNAIVIDCWKYGDEGIFSECVKYIEDEEVTVWLEQTPPDNGKPCAGLRLIHKFDDSMSLKDLIIDAINDKFGLPDVPSHIATSLTGACGKFMTSDSKSVIIVCRRTLAMRTVSVIVRHDFETDTTVGYLLSDGTAIIHHCLLAIPRQFRVMSHPLLIPILIGDDMLEGATNDLTYVDNMIVDIEDGTGFNNYDEIENDLSTKDYRELSRDLGEAASKFAHLKSRILTIRTMYEFLSRELRSYQSWIPTDKWDIYSGSTQVLIERVGYAASHIEHLLVYRGIEMRLQVQQNVIFNLIAQEDNYANIKLSEEMKGLAIKAKRDGSIMKTIAFLGTVFLPATFVSTLFAMPLFNWQAPTVSEIVTSHFWIYGAVTGPLTLVTMLIVGYWILSRTQKNLSERNPPDEQPKSPKVKRLKKVLGLRKRHKFDAENGVFEEDVSMRVEQ